MYDTHNIDIMNVRMVNTPTHTHTSSMSMTFTPESGEASENGQYSAITPFKILSIIAVTRIVRSFFLVCQ